MKVLNRNVNESKYAKCACEAELEYEKDDIQIGAFGCGYVECPMCHSKIFLDDEGVELTIENVQFPKHYASTNQAIAISDKEIQKKSQGILRRLEEREEDYGVFDLWASGDSFIIGIKFEDEYFMVVARNYYETSIPRD